MLDLTPYTALIDQTATAYHLPSGLLEAQVAVESSGDPLACRFEPRYFDLYLRKNLSAKSRAYGPLGAISYGLLQILLETAMEIGFTGRPEDLFVPITGLTWGAKYLASLLPKVNDDYPSALAAYNAGLGNLSAGRPYAYKVYTRAQLDFPGLPTAPAA